MSVPHQDWKTLYVHLDKKNQNGDKDNKVTKKTKGPGNNLDKTDLDTFKNKKISQSFSVNMRNARNSKNMTQKDLAQKINVRPNVINDYESGKAIPNPKTLNNIKRILGI